MNHVWALTPEKIFGKETQEANGMKNLADLKLQSNEREAIREATKNAERKIPGQ